MTMEPMMTLTTWRRAAFAALALTGLASVSPAALVAGAADASGALVTTEWLERNLGARASATAAPISA